MPYDPFLDPPRRRGCVVAVFAVALVVAPALSWWAWGPGDALAAAGWIAVIALVAWSVYRDRRADPRVDLAALRVGLSRDTRHRGGVLLAHPETAERLLEQGGRGAHPAGGPPWQLRIITSTRVEPGRVLWMPAPPAVPRVPRPTRPDPGVPDNRNYDTPPPPPARSDVDRRIFRDLLE